MSRALSQYWVMYAHTLERVRSERPNTLAELKLILDEFEAPSAGVAFFPTGGDDNLADALGSARWSVVYLEGDYLWDARSPITREWIHGAEGDIYAGRFVPSEGN
jgi:hypothetical protein